MRIREKKNFACLSLLPRRFDRLVRCSGFPHCRMAIWNKVYMCYNGIGTKFACVMEKGGSGSTENIDEVRNSKLHQFILLNRTYVHMCLRGTVVWNFERCFRNSLKKFESLFSCLSQLDSNVCVDPPKWPNLRSRDTSFSVASVASWTKHSIYLFFFLSMKHSKHSIYLDLRAGSLKKEDLRAGKINTRPDSYSLSLYSVVSWPVSFFFSFSFEKTYLFSLWPPC